ncbi:hypothetical protein A3F65_01745 [Candidatus Saccharibacteria bacterium RIFCSPHIGHO2_12_FULL_47_16b]|nr:MAG: hypothetical protein A3F65_01745 [Candidatus Saccharibacteria bacterium RIFCSPHIGHO2_12_FULL_47_16b]
MTNKTNLDAIKKAKSRADFLERILDEPLEKKDNTVRLIGIFVVYEQFLELKLKTSLLKIYSHKSAVTREGVTLIAERRFENLTLGNLKEELKAIKFFSNDNEDFMKDLMDKLSPFVNRRNDYIHRILQGEIKLDEKSFKAQLKETMKELADLIVLAEKLEDNINDHFDLDGSIVKFADHVIERK